MELRTQQQDGFLLLTLLRLLFFHQIQIQILFVLLDPQVLFKTSLPTTSLVLSETIYFGGISHVTPQGISALTLITIGN